METFVTIIAGLVLAGAASVGLVVTQGGAPSGPAPTTSTDVTAVYGSGQ